MPIDDLLTLEMAIATATVAVAGLMRGFAGFGGTLVIVSALSLLFGPVQAVAVAMLLSSVVNVQLMPGALPLTNWREIAPMGVAALLTPSLGAMILIAVEPDTMRRVIALVVIAFSALLASGWRFKGRRSTRLSFAVGALSGVITGAVGAGGAPIILYIFSSGRPAAEKRANIISVFAILLVGTVGTFILQGIIDGQILWRAAFLAPVFLATAWIGQRTFQRADDRIYQRVALAVLFTVSAVALFA